MSELTPLEQYIVSNNRVWPFATYEPVLIVDYGSVVASVTKVGFLKRIAEENRPAFVDHPDAKCFACDKNGRWFKSVLTSEVKIVGAAWISEDEGYSEGWDYLQEGKPIGGWRESLMIRTEKKQFTKADLKDGMKLTCNYGHGKLLLGKLLLMARGNGDLIKCDNLDNYLDDLTSAKHRTPPVDIVKVEYMGEIIWERPAPKTEPKPEPTDKEVFVNNLRNWVARVSCDKDLEDLYDKGFRYLGDAA